MFHFELPRIEKNKYLGSTFGVFYHDGICIEEMKAFRSHHGIYSDGRFDRSLDEFYVC